MSSLRSVTCKANACQSSASSRYRDKKFETIIQIVARSVQGAKKSKRVINCSSKRSGKSGILQCSNVVVPFHMQKCAACEDDAGVANQKAETGAFFAGACDITSKAEI
jgi:hypothetical protein